METNKTTKKDIFMIDPRNIVVEEGFNSRCDFGDLDELASQIAAQGVLNPIHVIAQKDADGVERYHLVDGERRYRAIMLNINNGIEIARVPALFVSKSTTREDLFIQQAMCNEGKNFTEYEYGILVKKLMDLKGYTVTEAANKLKKNVGQMTYALQDLEYDERVQELLRTNKISGANVRRIYQMHKGDEAGAVEEILALQNVAEKKGKKKLSLKDLDLAGKTILAKDSKTIKDGLTKLFAYLNKMDEDAAAEIDIYALLDSLNSGCLINEVLGLDDAALHKAAE